MDEDRLRPRKLALLGDTFMEQWAARSPAAGGAAGAAAAAGAPAAGASRPRRRPPRPRPPPPRPPQRRSRPPLLPPIPKYALSPR